MRVRALILVGVAGSALALGGCFRGFHHHGRQYKAVTTLTCPESQGDLTRKTASPDGKSCDYAGPSGAVVSLQIVPVTADGVSAALTPLETRLRAEIPAQPAPAAGGKGEGRVDIDLPGIHIHASGRDNENSGDAGNVSIGNWTADGGGSVDVQAHDKGAEIRVDDSHGGLRRKFILASDTPGPNGYRVAGYDARGPQGGPLVVASLLAKSDDQDEFSDDIGRLLQTNVGGR